MEWSDDFPYSPLEESLYDLLSPPQLEMPKPAEWTSEENKAFENALAELDPSSPAFFEDLASKVPWRSVEELKIHYQALVEDVEMIESGVFPVPDYPAPHAEEKQDDDEEDHEAEHAKKKEEGATHNNNQPKTKTGHPRRRGVPWSEEEHKLFLMGLNKYGKGDWRSISRYYVITKTPTQVASHAQKYFRRQTNSTPPDRRRPSIHDIHTVNPPPPPTNMSFAPPPPPPLISLQHQHQQIPFSSCALIPSLNHQGFINGGINLDQNSGFFPPVAVNSAANDHVLFNQPPSAAAAAAALPPLPPSSSYFLPSFRNQNWGSL